MLKFICLQRKLGKIFFVLGLPFAIVAILRSQDLQSPGGGALFQHCLASIFQVFSTTQNYASNLELCRVNALNVLKALVEDAKLFVAFCAPQVQQLKVENTRTPSPLISSTTVSNVGEHETLEQAEGGRCYAVEALLLALQGFQCTDSLILILWFS